MKLYSLQFENKNKLIGQTISKVVFYLEKTDKDFTEHGIDIQTNELTFSIGNRFTNSGYGLSFDIESMPVWPD